MTLPLLPQKTDSRPEAFPVVGRLLLPVALAFAGVPLSAADSPDADFPVDAVLTEIEMSVPSVKYNRPQGETEFTFTLKPQQPGWVLSEAIDGKRSGQEGKLRPFFLGKKGEDGLEVSLTVGSLARNGRMEINETLHLIRSKTGTTLPVQTIELGKAGSFEAGGIRFEYRSKREPFEVFSNHQDTLQGRLTLSWPEGISVARVAIADEKGRVLTTYPAQYPARRRDGEADYAFYIASDMKNVQVTVTLSEADMPLELPLRKVIAIGGETKTPPSSGIVVKNPLPLPELSAADSPVEVKFKGIRANLGKTNELNRKLAIELQLKPRGEWKLMEPQSFQTLYAFDAEGNDVKGLFAGNFFNAASDGSTKAYLEFPIPKGDWVQVDTVLHLLLAKRVRTLPFCTVPLKGKGVFEVGNIRFEYGGKRLSFLGPDTKNQLVISYPTDGRVASIAFRDNEGKPIDVQTNGCCCSSGTLITQAYDMPENVRENVQIVVTRFEDIEPCVIPVKMKINLGGEIEPQGNGCEAEVQTCTHP